MTDPRPHTVYRCYNANRDLLYVGMSVNPSLRYREHRGDKAWWPEVADIETTEFPTRGEARAAEKAAIGTEGPRHNTLDVRNRSTATDDLPDDYPVRPDGASIGEWLALLGDYRVKVAAELKQDTAELKSAVIKAASLGISESELARLSGMQRMTIRSWLGKR